MSTINPAVRAAQEQARKRDGKFGTQQHTDPEGAALSAAAELPRQPFSFNKDYNDLEQVRPYQADYEARRAELDAKGGYPYNADFKGHLPSLGDVDDEAEDTAIYLLQNLHRQDEEQRAESEFLADGGKSITLRDEFDDHAKDGVLRGTVVLRGQYSGGLGWSRMDDVRVTRDGRGGFIVLPKGRRTNGYRPTSRILFKPSGKR
ncbi:MAG: hypothetical protein ACTH0V_05180 [Microbacteriaceae bacterium]